MRKELWQETRIQKIMDKIDILFAWTRLFYPKFKGMKNYYLLFYFLPQKVLRINGTCFWPVHFTSRVLFSRMIQVGANSAPGLSNGCYIQGKNGIVIGRNLRMGLGVGLISANHNPDNYDQWLKADSIEIGDNVWIGMNSVILPGVKIGSNVIIGANSVVNKDVPSNTIVAGNPATIIREKSKYQG